jgi:hypothetical protein
MIIDLLGCAGFCSFFFNSNYKKNLTGDPTGEMALLFRGNYLSMIFGEDL